MGKNNICYKPRSIIDKQNDAIDRARRKGKNLVKLIPCTDEEQKQLLRFYGVLFTPFYSIKRIRGNYYISLDDKFK